MRFYETYTNRRLFNSEWVFSKQPYGAELSDCTKWQKIDIPHDWLIYDTGNLYETSTGWYKKCFNYEKRAGVRTSIRFEGVYMDSTVFVNGEKAGDWKYGYSTFEFDITDFIKNGENKIMVRVNYRCPNTRWYSGAGIYRRVWLCESPETRFASDGIYISTDGDKVTVSSEVIRPEKMPVTGISIKQTILDAAGKIVSEITSEACACDRSCIPEAVRLDNVSYAVTTQNMLVKDHTYWDIENPYLYTLVSELIVNGDVVQKISNTFGFRKIEFTSDEGFFLNGRHVKLHGSCEHHDSGALGAATNRAALCRRLVKLREMGVNAIRTSHNMPAVELMELADEMGFLILSEGFDMWERPKTDYDYGNYFDEWVEKDVASWVRRDRNHPSLIGWSIGNEIYDTHADERGQEVTSWLLRLVRIHDSRANGYVTSGSNYMQWENAQKCGDILKLVGYNYSERLYEEHHEKHPDWMIYGSETSSVVQSRGIYHFPLAHTVLADDDEQCSALGNSTTGWAAKNTEECIIKDRDAKFCAGQFIWTGFDYIGEPTPYSTKNSYFGQYDTAGFPKDSAYIFRAEWTDYKKAPFVHIFPYWDFNIGQPIDVRVCSNAPRVELFLDGVSQGAFDIDHENGQTLTLNHIIDYRPGELTALAYDEGGNVIAKDFCHSFSDAARLEVLPDKTKMNADGEDLIYLEISAYDADGHFCANANNRVNVSVSGAGRLMGMDNGDSTDYDQYKSTSRRLFSGKLLAIIGARKEAGEIIITIESPGISAVTVTLNSVPCETDDGVSAVENVTCMETECGRTDDIPVRKIELCTEILQFTPDVREITVNPVIKPANATYASEIEYRVTNELGVKTHLGCCSINNDGSVTVKANGDGTFFLRALCKNGTEKYHLISVLKFTAEGLGDAVIDPYEFVCGGLYSRASENIGNGINRGVGFSYEKSWAAYENVDFGSAGAEKITVPIFANTFDPVRIRFYDGIPGEGGELLGDFEYHKTPEWLTYQPETYILSHKLKGLHTFCMESDCGFQAAGFTFEKNVREFSNNNAVDADSIYGDKFSVEADAVIGIGNNVMLNFGEFDFGEKTPSGIVICGKSELPLNSIHVIIDDGSETKRILAEFKGTVGSYTEQTFALAGVAGTCKVSFAFLPGSSFDFKYFRFTEGEIIGE